MNFPNFCESIFYFSSLYEMWALEKSPNTTNLFVQVPKGLTHPELALDKMVQDENLAADCSM